MGRGLGTHSQAVRGPRVAESDYSLAGPLGLSQTVDPTSKTLDPEL